MSGSPCGPRTRIRTGTGVPEREEGGAHAERRPRDQSEQLGAVLDEHGRLRGHQQEVGDDRDPEPTEREEQESDVEVAKDRLPESHDEAEEGEPVGCGDQCADPGSERRSLVQQQEVVEHEHQGQHGDPPDQPGPRRGGITQDEPPDGRGAAREREHDDADVRDQSVDGTRAGTGGGDHLAVAQQVAGWEPRLHRGHRGHHHDRKHDGEVHRGRRAREGACEPRDRAFIGAGATHGISTPAHATLRPGFGFGRVGGWVRRRRSCGSRAEPVRAADRGRRSSRPAARPTLCGHRHRVKGLTRG